MAIPNLYPNLFGDFDSRDLLDRPAAEVPQPDLYDAIQQALQVYRELTQDITGILAVTSTVAKEAYAAALPGSNFSGAGLLQVRGEYGKVLATRPLQAPFSEVESAFEVGYPIHAFGTRAMFTPEFLLRATVRDVNNQTVIALMQDYETLFRHVLAGIFDNQNYPFLDDKVLGQNLGTFEVKRLLNADSIPGVIRYDDGSTVPLGAINHYKVSGTTQFTNGTFQMAHDALVQVGMDSDIVYFISKNNEAEVRLLSDFVPFDPPATDGPGRDPRIIDPQPQGPGIPGDLPPSRSIVRSPRSIGRMRSVDANSGEVIILPWMPTNYLFAMDRSADKPVVIRESDIAALRGFNLVSADGMTPAIGGDKLIVNKYWQRVFGVGVRNRANGVLVQITQNATYTAPQFFLM